MSLTSINAEKVQMVGAKAFKGTGLTEITLKEIRQIKQQAFDGNPLVTIELGNNLESIAMDAFEGCEITTATTPCIAISSIPKTLTTCTIIGNDVTNNTLSKHAFSDFDKLETVTLSDKIIVSESSFEGCEALTYVSFNESYRPSSIGKNAFKGCINLSIAIPDSIEEIEDGAFEGCGFTDIDIASAAPMQRSRIRTTHKPTCNFSINSKIKTLGNAVFKSNTQLKNINLPMGVENIGQDILENCEILESVKIPVTATNIGTISSGTGTTITAPI
jgi:hypothetical protein